MELATAFNDAWHRQPDPADRPDGRRPTSSQWVLVAALWLLAAWKLEFTPGWASTLVLHKTGDRRDGPWPASPEQLAAIADLPEVTGAVPYASMLSKDGHSMPPEELVSLIAGAAHIHDARRTALVRYFAEETTGRWGDLLRLFTTDDDPALHLLHRDYFGMARITLTPAPTVQQPPVLADDGADGAIRTRISCLATLLSNLLMVNNNNSVNFRFRIGTLPESDTQDNDCLAAAIRWWSATREDAEEYADEKPTFRPITFTELRTSLHNDARLSLVDIWDGSWSGIDEMPEIPAGHVVTHLVDDLVNVIEGRMGGALVAVNGYLPTGWPPADPTDEDDDDGEYTYVLFVLGNEVGVLDIDRSY
ncbi:hypothetical protein [Streptomyces sp. NBC_01643]|uniref:hypothetical protein n=1 Tax=Streptomyces sp. NBC_01643 TaxID=2975906 RepID=UPI003864C222|nr:hypothetical protein OHB03_49270 [Streptomyces sp. NBC_01643]